MLKQSLKNFATKPQVYCGKKNVLGTVKTMKSGMREEQSSSFRGALGLIRFRYVLKKWVYPDLNSGRDPSGTREGLFGRDF